MSLTRSLQLSPDQKQSFIKHGFLKLPQLLSPDILQELRDATDRLCDLSIPIPQVAAVTGSDGQMHVIGIEKMGSLSESIFREILGSPLLLSLAEAICGADFFPVQDFMVIKSSEDGNEVKWHQDILTKPLSKTIMIGFYLDPANDANGALRVIPGSHKSELPICELEKMDYTSIEMEAGDVLIHDLMLAHSSGKLTHFPKRRVVYFEFMSAEQALDEHIYPEAFVNVRRELTALAIQCFNQAYPQAEVYLPEQLASFAPADNPVDDIKTCYEVRRDTHVANYCFEQFGGS